MIKENRNMAIAYDFDGTLAPGNMQEYNFIPDLNMDKGEFWQEANELAKKHDMDEVLAYMHLMLIKAKEKNIPIREEYHWKSLMPQTKIVLITTFWIIAIGSILFFFIERNRTLSLQTSLFDKIFTSIFQIVTCRTSGFMVLDVNNMALASIIMIIVLMFIGGSPGSTAGGVKTTTFFVLIRSVMATIQGKKRIEFQHKTISFNLVDKATSLS